MTFGSTIAAVHLAATAAMVGLIWFVQVIHYPLMAAVGDDAFAAYERAHVRLTTVVVAPIMLIEVAAALALVLSSASSRPSVAAWVGLGLLLVIWVATATCSVPMHARLEAGFDPQAHAFLVRTNWIRTIGWTLRLAVALVWLRPST